MASPSFSLMIASFLAFIAFSHAVFAFSPSNYAITCTSHSWWALFPLNASIVDPWVPRDFPFIPTASLPSAFSTLPTGQRMVTLEFNKQIDCFPKALPFIKTTFTEFKVQVPFLNAKNFDNKAPLMFKPVIYADNLINVAGGSLQYGLNVEYASPMTYDVNNGLYTVNENGSFVKGAFTPTSSWMPWSGVSSSSLAAQYQPMHESTEWLGHDVPGNIRCAKHYYLWNETRIRFVNANIKFDQGLVGPTTSPAFSVIINGDEKQNLQTAFQIETVHHISGLEECSH